MTNTNLSQMPYNTAMQKEAFREAALKRERELLVVIKETMDNYLADYGGCVDIAAAESALSGYGDPLGEIAKNNPGLYMRHVTDDMIINYG